MPCCFVVVFFLNKILLLSKKSNSYKIKIYKRIIKVKKSPKISFDTLCIMLGTLIQLSTTTLKFNKLTKYSVDCHKMIECDFLITN